MNYSVYILTNIVNFKVYIGITKQKVSARLGQHKSDSKRGSQCPIHRAIRKYGLELNLNPRSVQRVLKGKFKQTKGYHFVYTNKDK